MQENASNVQYWLLDRREDQKNWWRQLLYVVIDRIQKIRDGLGSREQREVQKVLEKQTPVINQTFNQSFDQSSCLSQLGLVVIIIIFKYILIISYYYDYNMPGCNQNFVSTTGYNMIILQLQYDMVVIFNCNNRWNLNGFKLALPTQDLYSNSQGTSNTPSRLPKWVQESQLVYLTSGKHPDSDKAKYGFNFLKKFQ